MEAYKGTDSNSLLWVINKSVKMTLWVRNSLKVVTLPTRRLLEVAKTQPKTKLFSHLREFN